MSTTVSDLVMICVHTHIHTRFMINTKKNKKNPFAIDILFMSERAHSRCGGLFLFQPQPHMTDKGRKKQ